LWHDEETFFRQEVLRFDNLFYAGGLAEIFRQNKDYTQAKVYFEKAIKQAPLRADIYINYAALLLDLKRPEEALAYLDEGERIVVTYKNKAELYNNKGASYYLLNRPKKAIQYFSLAVKYSPGEAKFWANLGASYIAAGDFKNSIPALKKGLEIAPESIRLRKYLASSYIHTKDYEKAIMTFEEIPGHVIDSNKDLEELLEETRNKLWMEDY
jgi:tetratricopeptide (TPR) repeat protein